MAEGDERQAQGRVVVNNEGVFMLCTIAVVAYAAVLLLQLAFGDDDD